MPENGNFAYETLGEHTHLTFEVHFLHVGMGGGTYYTYQTMLLWPEFVAEGTTGLSFCACLPYRLKSTNSVTRKVKIDTR